MLTPQTQKAMQKRTIVKQIQELRYKPRLTAEEEGKLDGLVSYLCILTEIDYEQLLSQGQES